jgi:hypothetical protein
MNKKAQQAVQALNPSFSLDLVGGIKTRRFYNHCPKCGAVQKDPGSGNAHPFKPQTVEQAKAITLHHRQFPFEGFSFHQSNVSFDYGVPAFDLMKRD